MYSVFSRSAAYINLTGFTTPWDKKFIPMSGCPMERRPGESWSRIGRQILSIGQRTARFLLCGMAIGHKRKT